MNTTIVFTMIGFNSKSRKITLYANDKYNYSNNNLFKSVYINDNLSEITFELQPNKTYEEYRDEIHIELERICFNLILSSDILTTQPYCTLKYVKSDSDISLHDRFTLSDKFSINVSLPANLIYKQALNSSNAIKKHSGIYKEIFFILQNPLEAIQFLALYDIMQDLICGDSEQPQKILHDFFGKNKNKYSFISFKPSIKYPDKMQDSFTHLRNALAHSRTLGAKEYIKIVQSISKQDIKNILFVINDYLCSKKS